MNLSWIDYLVLIFLTYRLERMFALMRMEMRLLRASIDGDEVVEDLAPPTLYNRVVGKLK